MRGLSIQGYGEVAQEYYTDVGYVKFWVSKLMASVILESPL